MVLYLQLTAGGISSECIRSLLTTVTGQSVTFRLKNLIINDNRLYSLTKVSKKTAGFFWEKNRCKCSIELNITYEGSHRAA